MLIPWETLPSETLNNIIESFVLREGTDYGAVEKSLTQKVQDIKRQLARGELSIVWSELHDSVSIISKQDIKLSANPYQE